MALIALVCMLASSPPLASAAGFYPTRSDDPVPDGCRPLDCSLREAVMSANAASGFDFIQLGSVRYTLSRATPPGTPDTASDGDLDITDAADLFILGTGSSQTVLDGGQIDRVIDIASGARVSIWSVQIRNGIARLDNRTGHVHGGGIHNHGNLGLFWSTVNYNFSGNDWGGGGLTNAGNGTAVISDVTFTGNLTSQCGGAIENGGNLTVFNSTLVANNAGAGRGPGIANGTGSSGCFFGGGTARLNNTIVADQNYDNCLGTLQSLGHNLATDSTCGFQAPGDLVTSSVGLQPVFDAEGALWLYELMPGSPAIDAGSARYDPQTDTGCSPVDQTGTARPLDGDGDGTAVCDIGAYEAPAITVPPPPKPPKPPRPTKPPPKPGQPVTPIPPRPSTMRPLPDVSRPTRARPRLRIRAARIVGRHLRLTGRIAAAARRRMTVTLRIERGGRDWVRSTPVRPLRGRFTARIRIPSAIPGGARGVLTVRYPGDSRLRSARVRRPIRLPGSPQR